MESIDKIKKQKSKEFDRALKRELRKVWFKREESKDKKTRKEKVWGYIMAFLMINFLFVFVFTNIKTFLGGVAPNIKQPIIQGSTKREVEKEKDFILSNFTSFVTTHYEKKIANDILDEGDKLVVQKKYAEAIEFFSKVINKDSNNIEAYKRLANIYVTNGKDYEAFEVYKKIISLNPKDIVIYKNMGDLKIKMQSYEEAYIYYNEAIKFKTKDIAIYNNLAYVLVKLQKYQEAIQIYDEALKIDANDKQVLTNKQSLMKALESN